MFGLSPEQARFAKTSRCPNGDFLLGTLVLVDGAGEPISVVTPYFVMDRSAVAKCPRCGATWAVFGDGQPAKMPHGPWSVKAINETERFERQIGVDQQIIDASGVSSDVTQKLTFSRHWTQTIDVESEKSHTTSLGGKISLGDVLSLEASVEQAVRDTYGISSETGRTNTQEVQVTVKAGKRLQISLHWKIISQAGTVELEQSGVGSILVPFVCAADLSFDQVFKDL
jgi:hypothetical protein